MNTQDKIRLDSETYIADVRRVVCEANWSPFEGSTVAITGATGLVGSFLVDVLMNASIQMEQGIDVVAIGRSESKARERLPYFDNPSFSFDEMDISVSGTRPSKPADVVFHLASSTHPRAYAAHPVSTITSNVIGLTNLLEYVRECDSEIIFASSVEIYGGWRGDVDKLGEEYCGYINCNTMRAGYPEAKRCCESLCQAYLSEYNVKSYIPRLPRTYGPTMLPDDSKAVAQFIRSAVRGDDIVLKSAGTQRYSFLHVADVVSAMLYIKSHGETGAAYNIADSESDVSLKELAATIADLAGVRVVFDVPDEAESAGYSHSSMGVLDTSKLNGLGWNARYTLREGLSRSMRVLSDL